MTQFKPIEEVYPECMRESFYPGGDLCFDAPGDYVPLLESFGYDILLQVDDKDYQGDSRVLFKDGDRYGILVFGWGSCSGCDRLQGCDSYKEIDELRDSLDSGIQWGSLAETLAYLKEHDWEGDWCGRDALTSGFVERAIVVLESEQHD